MSNFEGVRMAHLQAVVCFSLYSPTPTHTQQQYRQQNKTLSCGVCKRKSTEQNLMLIGFPSQGITLRTSIICGNLNYFGVSFGAPLVNENGMLGPLCLPLLFMSFSSLLFMLPFLLLLILSSLIFLLQVDQRRIQCRRSDNTSDAQGFQLNFRD